MEFVLPSLQPFHRLNMSHQSSPPSTPKATATPSKVQFAEHSDESEKRNRLPGTQGLVKTCHLFTLIAIHSHRLGCRQEQGYRRCRQRDMGTTCPEASVLGASSRLLGSVGNWNGNSSPFQQQKPRLEDVRDIQHRIRLYAFCLCTSLHECQMQHTLTDFFSIWKTLPPVFVALIVVSLWAYVDIEIKKMQPYVDLVHGNSPPQRSLLLDYSKKRQVRPLVREILLTVYFLVILSSGYPLLAIVIGW